MSDRGSLPLSIEGRVNGMAHLSPATREGSRCHVIGLIEITG